MEILQKFVKIVFIILMLISLAWFFIYQTPLEFSYDETHRIIDAGVGILQTLRNRYQSSFLPVLGIFVSVINIIFSAKGIYRSCKLGKSNKNNILIYLTYATVSLFALIINFIAFNEILRGILSV